MHPRRHPSEALLRSAQRTALITSRTDLIKDGFSDHVLHDRVEDGHWQSLGKGLYRLAPDPLTWRHYAVAARLAYGERAAIGGMAAAYAFRLVDDPPDTVTVRVPTRRTLAATGLWVPRTDWIDRCERGIQIEDRARLGGVLRVTSLGDTVLDRLAELGGEDEVVAWLTKVFSRSPYGVDLIRLAVGQRSRIPHRQLVTDVLEEGNRVHSVLEYRYQVNCQRPHGLPMGELQASIRRGAVHDVAYRPYRTLVELDGALYHDEEQRRLDDRRDNTSNRQGWRTLRYGWDAVVGDPCGVAAEVADVLRQEGWEGQLTRCPRCP